MSQVLQEEILLELRELNTHTRRTHDQLGNTVPGDYVVPLETNITISEGDEVSIKSCFIDSVDSSSGKIVITEEDATIQIQNGLYLKDWGFGDTRLTYTDERIHYDTSTGPSGKEYYLTKNVVNDASRSEIFSMRFFIDDGKTWRRTNGEDAEFYLIYDNFDNSVSHLHFTIPKDKVKIQQLPNKDDGSFFDLDVSTRIGDDQQGLLLPFTCKTGSLQIDPKNASKMGEVGVYVATHQSLVGLIITPETQVIPDSGATLAPQTFTSTFTIKTGSYTPAALADTLSREFSKVKPDDENFIQNEYVDSNFLFTSQEIKTKPSLGNGTHMLFADKDGSDVVGFHSGNNFWVGSSQFGIVYNEDSGKFQIDRIHDSLYSENGLSIIKTLVSAGGERFVANKTGGIFFTDLQPKSLWVDKLGFDLNSLLVRPTGKITKSIGALNDINLYPINLEDGKTTTGDDADLDSFILKKVDQTDNEFFDQPLASGFANIESAGSTSNSIIAKEAVNTTENDNNTPYYQVELDLGFNQKKIGANNQNNKISGIISKFYDSASYSSSMDNSGSRPYYHKGADVQLSDIRVRLLNPEGFLTSGIGEDNVVFLSIIKPK